MSFPVELVLLAGGGETFSAFKKQIKLPFAPYPGLKLIAGWYAVTNAAGFAYPDQVEFHVRDVEYDITTGVFFCFEVEGAVDAEVLARAEFEPVPVKLLTDTPLVAYLIDEKHIRITSESIDRLKEAEAAIASKKPRTKKKARGTRARTRR